MIDGLDKMAGNGIYRGAVAPVIVTLLFLLSGCATIAMWQKWSPGEQKQYFGLTFIEDNDSLPARYRSLASPEQRDSCYKAYWESRDPTGKLLSEHQERLNRAWDQFGGRMFFKDDRSRILVRYGDPESEVKNQPYMHALGNEQLSGGKYIKELSWIVWEYPSQGRYYDFIMNDSRYEMVAATYGDKMHPLAFFKADSGVLTGGLPKPGILLPMECGGGRFRSNDASRVRWEIYWRIPVPERRPAEGGGKYLMVFSLFASDRMTSCDTVGYRIEYTGDDIIFPRAFGQRNYDLAPGRYRIKLELLSQSGSASYAGEIEAELVGYRAGIRETSDVEMSVLQDSTYISADFRKNEYRRVIPAISGKIGRYQPFFVYYEAYSLATDRYGEHHVNVGQGIYLSDTSGTMKECIIDTKEIYYHGPGDLLAACHKIHPMAMEPGEYILVVNVRDLISGRTSRLTHRFEIDGSAAVRQLRERTDKSLPAYVPPKPPARQRL